jgi:DNA polymerase (family 10)
VTSAELFTSIQQLADLADIRGTSPEASAWRRLAASIQQAEDDEPARLRELAERDRLGDIVGLPPSLQRKLQGLLLEPPDALLRLELATIPWLHRRLLELDAIDSARAALLARLGIVTAADLAASLQAGSIAGHLTGAVEERLRIALDALSFERHNIPLGRAAELADGLVSAIAAACPALHQLLPAGDIRRFEPLVTSIVIVACADDPPGSIDTISALPSVRAVLHSTSRRALVSYQQTEVDVRVPAPDEFGSVLHLATGSAEHLAAMRVRQAVVRICAREEDVYAQAGLAWIPPELRNDSGEIEAATKGTLPPLVTREQIRGDLHMHSTYSDGRDTLAEMVQTCAGLGYEYIAITDHSERAGASRTVSIDALARQREEIARLRARFPEMAILHGIEVDIMPNGTLDFPDHVLETLDIVLASLHDDAGHDPARLTRRCLAAINHPLVNVITHPANRLVGRHPGYDLDFPAIYAAASATGTALEIDGAPGHLDMDGEHARQAIAAGATVTIDSDCHRARLLDRQMRLGVGTARRGWVEPRHVLNTRPLAEVRAFLAAKRGWTGRA